LLNGFEGGWPKTDIPALSQLDRADIDARAQFHAQISEIEINPVLAHPQGQGATIVDALVVRKR